MEKNKLTAAEKTALEPYLASAKRTLAITINEKYWTEELIIKMARHLRTEEEQSSKSKRRTSFDSGYESSASKLDLETKEQITITADSIPSSPSESDEEEFSKLQTFFGILNKVTWDTEVDDELATLKDSLKVTFKENRELICDRLRQKKLPLLLLLAEGLNQQAFKFFVQEIFSKEEVERDIASLDMRNWNVYHCFVNGLVENAKMSRMISQSHLELLQQINNAIGTEDRREFLQAEPNIAEMLMDAYEVDDSPFYKQICELLEIN